MPLTRFLTGEHFESIVDLTRNDVTQVINPGATVQTRLRDEDTELTVTTASPEGHTDADWANGRIVAVFTKDETAAIPFEEGTNERSCELEILVNDTVDN